MDCVLLKVKIQWPVCR